MMENWAVWKIIYRTHQDVDSVADASEGERQTYWITDGTFP